MHDLVNKKILAALIHDDDFSRLAWSVLTPEHFEDSAQWTLASIAFAFFDKYGRAMKDWADKELEEHITASGMSGDNAEALMRLYADMRLSRTDIEIAQQEVIEFARHRALHGVLEEFIELHESGRVDKDAVRKIIASVEETQKIGERHSLRPDLIEGLPERFMRRLNLEDEYIPTLIGPLDARFIGARRGELCTIMAPSGKGKSWMLAHIAQAAHVQGYHVLHVSYEMTAEAIEERHDMMIAGVARENLKDPKVMSRIKAGYEKAAKWGGRIEVEWMPAGSKIIQTEQLIETVIETSGRPLDVICLDYGNLISPNRPTGNEYTDQGHVWQELTNIVKKFNCVIWVATQTNRQGAGAKVLSEYEIGDSILKYNHSDIFIGFNRSLVRNSKGDWVQIDDEWAGDEDNRIRLHVMKHRSGQGDRYHINFLSDFSRGLFYSMMLTSEKIEAIAEAKKKQETDSQDRLKRIAAAEAKAQEELADLGVV